MKLPFFRTEKTPANAFDPERWEPVLRCSICPGEQTAAFRERATGQIREIMLIRGEADLREFRRLYGIEGPVVKIY